MENLFEYSLDNKRYHTFNYYLKNKYHTKVAKVALNGNFTCPNRDGTKATGGCIFCSDLGSGDYAGNLNDDLMTQFHTVSQVMSHKWPNCKFIPYFQANSNTYDSVENLKKRFEPFLLLDNVVGLALATRCDCLNNDVLDYLDDLNKRCDLYVELGLQTIHESTSQLINRGHSLNEFEQGLNELRKRNIHVCVHIINGLPYETKEDMIETARYLSTKDIQAIKIHNLYILENTKLHDLYLKKPFHILSKEEYIDIVVNQLRLLKKDLIIERLTGDAPLSSLVEPKWSIKKVTVLNDIDKYMKKRNCYQGDQYNPPI